MPIPECRELKEKWMRVYLYRADNCIRGWLAYRTLQSTPTITIEVKATTGEKAKNKAITVANQGFPKEQCRIIEINDLKGDRNLDCALKNRLKKEHETKITDNYGMEKRKRALPNKPHC